MCRIFVFIFRHIYHCTCHYFFKPIWGNASCPINLLAEPLNFPLCCFLPMAVSCSHTEPLKYVFPLGAELGHTLLESCWIILVMTKINLNPTEMDFHCLVPLPSCEPQSLAQSTNSFFRMNNWRFWGDSPSVFDWDKVEFLSAHKAA